VRKSAILYLLSVPFETLGEQTRECVLPERSRTKVKIQKKLDTEVQID